MPDSLPAGMPRSRRLARVAENPREAIYGTIVAMGVIAASAVGDEPAKIILADTVATLLVFWLAHVYVDVLANKVQEAWHGQTGMPMMMARQFLAVMTREFSMVAAPALSLLFLLLSVLGLLEKGAAVTLALWSGVAQLVGWGIAVARKPGRSWPGALLGGVSNGAFGLVIVGLESLLH
jgi:hypothetical protein